MLRALPLLTALTMSAPAAQPPTFDFAALPSPERLRAVKFLPVPADAAVHPVEERGFVAVPMDYARRGESPTLRIFYRLMPARGSTPRDTRAPIAVVVNGGPGYPSSSYRPYDYDYRNPTERMREQDVLGEMLSRFRILILDQRGTGRSAPLDAGDPHLDPTIVARYFDSAHHALDHQEVIRAVIPDGEPFYMVAQSYAGKIGMRYLTMPGITRRPRGLVFSSASLPYVDTVAAFEARRRGQLALNHQLRRFYPTVADLLGRLRAHFREEGFDPGSVHYLWTWLGKGPAGTWEPALVERVVGLLRADRRGLQAFLDQEADKAELLNYILSAKELTPGFTDVTLAALLQKRIPFESWMLDEQATDQRPGGGAWIRSLVDALDRRPPPLDPPFPPLAEIRERLGRQFALFTVAKGDAFIGEEVALSHVRRFEVEGKTRVLVLPGGHKAVFLAPGVEALASWIASLPP